MVKIRGFPAGDAFVNPGQSDRSMKIELWPIDRVTPYARNARTITAAAVDKVAASIQEFGWRQPIVVDGERVIIAGHTRLWSMASE